MAYLKSFTGTTLLRIENNTFNVFMSKKMLESMQEIKDKYYVPETDKRREEYER